MKRSLFFIVIFALFLSVTATAQTNRAFRAGYRGSVELESSAFRGRFQDGTERPGELIQLATVHGYSWGNGVFLGMGVGYSSWLSEDSQFVSVFLNARYNIKDTVASPFIEGRTGYSFCTTTRLETGGLFVRMSVGVGFGHFSASLGYEYLPVKELEQTGSGLKKSFYTLDRLFLTLAFNF